MLGDAAYNTGRLVGTVVGLGLYFGIGGLIGYAIGCRKDHGGIGFILGALFWLVGWIITACIPKPARQGLPIQNSAGWWPDPYGRNEVRWYDGQQWTRDVATGGKQTVEAASPV